MDDSLVSMFDLSGKSAIVTGASRGLGVTFSRGLAKAGCNLVIAARDFEKLRGVADELGRYGTKIIPVKADMTNIREIQHMVDTARKEFGAIDILVNNAGVAAVREAEKMEEEDWTRVMDTNARGLFFCAQRAGRVMLEQGYGKIINVASMYGFVAASYVPQVSYVASKSAVLGITRELAVEWGPKGVCVVAIAPGFFRSDQTIWAFEQDKELGQKLLDKVPMGRMGKLEELEGTIVYLASRASDYMNGQALRLDGGFMIW